MLVFPHEGPHRKRERERERESTCWEGIAEAVRTVETAKRERRRRRRRGMGGHGDGEQEAIFVAGWQQHRKGEVLWGA